MSVPHRTFESKHHCSLLPSSNRSLGIIMFEVASIAYDRASMHGYFDPSQATLMMSSSGKNIKPAQKLTSKSTSTKNMPIIKGKTSPRRPRPKSKKIGRSSRRRNSKNEVQIISRNQVRFQDYDDTEDSITWSHPSFDLPQISCKTVAASWYKERGNMISVDEHFVNVTTVSHMNIQMLENIRPCSVTI